MGGYITLNDGLYLTAECLRDLKGAANNRYNGTPNGTPLWRQRGISEPPIVDCQLRYISYTNSALSGSKACEPRWLFRSLLYLIRGDSEIFRNLYSRSLTSLYLLYKFRLDR